MTRPGPKPLPGNVHLLHNNPSKKPLHELLGGLHPEVEIPGCPKHLLPEARKEWKRITAELLRYSLVSKLDRTALALYCQEYAWWVWHDTRLQADIARVTAKREAFEAAEAKRLADAEASGGTCVVREWTGGDGFTIPTPNGALTYNPHWVGRQRAAEKLDKFLASFGLSPSARSHVTPSSYRQRELFPAETPAPDSPPPAEGFGAL